MCVCVRVCVCVPQVHFSLVKDCSSQKNAPRSLITNVIVCWSGPWVHVWPLPHSLYICYWWMFQLLPWLRTVLQRAEVTGLCSHSTQQDWHLSREALGSQGRPCQGHRLLEGAVTSGSRDLPTFREMRSFRPGVLNRHISQGKSEKILLYWLPHTLSTNSGTLSTFCLNSCPLSRPGVT